MPHELAIGDALIPGVLLWFALVLALLWAFDALAGRFGLYRFVWHPPLFRVAVFVCVFCGFGLFLF